MTEKTAQLIDQLKLQPHPEGGYFRETYRSNGTIHIESLSKLYDGKRNYSTCIYFLLTSDKFSAFHKIHQDEIWHFYQGSPIHLHMIQPDGTYDKIIIGSNIDKGEVPQNVVSGGTWFASEVIAEDGYALAGCTVAPGFDFNDFELAERKSLIDLFPEYRESITQLTRG
ncbi:cupin domain-containing protein [Marinoscillum sp. MHG1-6]|uniref:cupin domain-containing protein n=1 Tax=Marinoscillum sp. MHG1-6 TaxID=2959627 RepID=UPI00215800F8|nr:cupin domain-containing protein [Marinoscillum sp. MHG1-6]